MILEIQKRFLNTQVQALTSQNNMKLYSPPAYPLYTASAIFVSTLKSLLVSCLSRCLPGRCNCPSHIFSNTFGTLFSALLYEAPFAVAYGHASPGFLVSSQKDITYQQGEGVVWTGTACSYLSSPCALKNVHQSTSHLLLIPHADHRFQHRAQHSVVAGNKLCKFFILLHGQDGDGLITGLDPNGRSPRFPFVGCRCADWVPFFHKLAASYTGHGNVDQPYVVVLVLFLLLLHILVDVNGDAVKRWETVELKVLSPENVVRFCFAGGAGKEGVIKAQLTEVFLLGGQVLCLNDPETEYIFSAMAVVLCERKSSALIQNP